MTSCARIRSARVPPCAHTKTVRGNDAFAAEKRLAMLRTGFLMTAFMDTQAPIPFN